MRKILFALVAIGIMSLLVSVASLSHRIQATSSLLMPAHNVPVTPIQLLVSPGNDSDLFLTLLNQGSKMQSLDSPSPATNLEIRSLHDSIGLKIKQYTYPTRIGDQRISLRPSESYTIAVDIGTLIDLDHSEDGIYEVSISYRSKTDKKAIDTIVKSRNFVVKIGPRRYITIVQSKVWDPSEGNEKLP